MTRDDHCRHWPDRGRTNVMMSHAIRPVSAEQLRLLTLVSLLAGLVAFVVVSAVAAAV